MSVTVHLQLGYSLEFIVMKLFNKLKNYFAWLNIRPNQKQIFNANNVLALFLLAFCSASSTIQMIFEENSIVEIGNSFYYAICFLFCFVTLSSNILKQSKMFGFIDKLENIIENSQLQFENTNYQFINLVFFPGPNNRRVYSDANVKIEKWSKFAYIAFVYSTIPFGMLPALLLSYYHYFVNDYGINSFSLTFPIQ